MASEHYKDWIKLRYVFLLVVTLVLKWFG